jgi:hypothetical protein
MNQSPSEYAIARHWYLEDVNSFRTRHPGRVSCDSIAALQLALGGLPDRLRVEVDSDIEISARTVGELRKVSAWPENLAITTPQDRYPDSTV